MKKRYKKYINKGKYEPLHNLLFHDHGKAPLKRLLMLNNKIVSNSNIHIAAHYVRKLPKKFEKYAMPHKHNCDEVNLILSENSKLIYEIELGSEKYIITSPASVFIPKGLSHCANVIKGRGIFICIVLKGEYNKSFIK